MKKKNKSLYVILIVLVIFGVSVGYAAMNRMLIITGNSEVKQNTWDLHFENIQVRNGSVEADSLPVIDATTKSTVNFNVMLNLPGDFYEFTVDVVNKGTIDAMIESITKTPELTAEQQKYLNYIIEYQNGEQIASKQLVEKSSFVRIMVRVEYRSDITENDLPTTSQNLNLGFILNYVQADDTGTNVRDNGVKVMPTANGSLEDVGTIVTIGTEQFYTIGTEGDNVKLISKYNLYVGGDFNSDTGVWTAYGDEATGMQDENMRGWVSNETIRKGITMFASEDYHGANYNDYNGSIIEGYVNNYKSLLESKFGLEVEEARLITREELADSNTFDCVGGDDMCSEEYEWIYLTSYWTGTPQSSSYVWTIYSTNGLFHSFICNYNQNFGVRPVIVISKSLF